MKIPFKLSLNLCLKPFYSPTLLLNKYNVSRHKRQVSLNFYICKRYWGICQGCKLNKHKYNNYWIKTIVVDNMSSSIFFSGRAFSISGRTWIKVSLTKVSPLLVIYSKLEKAMKQEKVSKNKNIMDEVLERKDNTICNMQGEICIFSTTLKM